MSFGVNDVVRVYGTVQVWRESGHGSGGYQDLFSGEVGKVIELYQIGLLKVKCGLITYVVHPKQCRRIKPRRRVWINCKYLDGADYGGEVLMIKDPSGSKFNGMVEFIEVKRPKGVG